MTQQERDEIRALVLSFSTRISDLPEVQSLSDADYITVVQNDGSKKHSKKATFRSLLELIKVHYPDNNGAKYQGVAHPTDSNVRLPIGTDGFWFAVDAGTYTNYGNITVGNSPKVIRYNVVTGEWSSEDLWGDINGSISFRLKPGEVANSLDTYRIPVRPNSVFVLGADCLPAGSLGSIVVSEFDYDGNLTKRTELESNPLDFIPQTGTDYIQVTLGYNASNPIDAEHSEVTLSSSLKNLVESLYNFIVDVLQGEYESRFDAIEHDITTIFSRISTLEGRLNQLANDISGLRTDVIQLTQRVSTTESNVTSLGEGLSGLSERVQQGFDNIQIGIDGIYARFEDDEGYISELQLTARLFQVRLSDAEGNISTLRQTAEEISAQVENAQGDIALLYIRADEIGTRVTNAEGDISTLTQRADSITAQVANAQGDIATLQITATQITSQVQNLQGDISVLTQTAQEISARVSNAEDDIAELVITADSISTRVSDAEGNISTLQQTSTALTARLENAEGDITALEVTANGLTTRVSNAEGDIYSLQITASGLESRVTDAEGSISVLTQTADEISARVSNAEGDISELTVTSQEIAARVTDAENNISELTITSEEIAARVSDAEDNISELQITADGLTTRVSDAEGNISTLQQTAESLTTRIGNAEGDISTLEQTATSLTTRIGNAEGDISTLEQTATSLTTRIGDAEGNISSLQQTATSLTSRITTAEGNITQINQDIDSIELSVQTVSDDLSDYETIVNATLDDLQNQIDGAIDTWFYNGAPTLSNLPASEWTTTDLKDMHIGDIYYDNESGYAYRFTKDSSTNVYSWTLITDSAVVQALADAARAQDTADHKRRVFVVQPTPPYDVGDLWVKERTVGNTTTHEIYRCITSRADGNFNAADWGPADSYGYQVNKSNLEVLSNAIIGQVISITYNQDGTISSSSASTIEQTSESIKLQVANSAISTGLASGGSINNALLPTGIDITNGNITLIADHISLKNQSNITGLDLITIGEAPNQRVVIDVTSLNVNGIFSTSPGSVWASQLANIEDYADDAADDAYTNAVSQAATNASTYITQNVLPLITTAQTTADNAQSAVNGLGYLATALNDGTTAIGGGLVLTSLVGLGGTSGSGDAWEMWSGINGQYDDDAPGYGIGAWYGGDAVDCVTIPGWADMTNQQKLDAWDTYRYARSLFRLDGSGYLANGAITWGAAGDLHLLDNVYIGPNMDQTLSSISTFITLLSTWFEDDIITVGGVAKHVLRVNMSGDTHDTGFAGVVWNGFLITQGDQIVQSGTPGGGGGGGGTSYLYELQDADDDLALPTIGSILYWGRKNNVNQWIGSSISSLTSGDVLMWEDGVWKNKASSLIGGVTSVAGRTGAITLTTSDITNIETWISGKNYLTSIANLTFQKSSGTKIYNGGTATTIKAEDLSAVVLGDTVGTVTITT